MKSSSERTLPSAVSSRPDTSSRTGAVTSTVTRCTASGMFEPGVIAVMPGVTIDPALPFPYPGLLQRTFLAPAPLRRVAATPGGQFARVPFVNMHKGHQTGPAGEDPHLDDPTTAEGVADA